jgi:pilus assembly protein CpaF
VYDQSKSFLEENMSTNSEKILAALGPLAELYADPAVLEILVDAPESVLVERGGRLVQADVRFESAQAIRALIDGLLALNEESVRPGETILPIRFPGGEARGMAVLPPTALQGPCLTIRKLMNIGWISWEQLIEWGSVTQAAVDCLRRAVLAPVNILVAGGTGSGKTTVANRVAEMISPEERLVIVENFHELQIRHPRAIYLEANGQPAGGAGVSMNELIATGAKMRPDWLIIGELHGPEAMRAVEVLGQGYSGMTTIHGNSLEDALARLEAMCLTANMGLGLLEIRGLIAAAVQLVCYQKHLPNGRRMIIEIAEMRGVENGQFVLERLFRYDAQQDSLDATGVKASWE